MRFKIERLTSGQYLATSADVPGLIGQGSNKAEALAVARSGPRPWTDSTSRHLCTDPSHPPLFHFPGQSDLYRQVIERIQASVSAGVHYDIVGSVADEAVQLIAQPNADSAEGYRIQSLRRTVATQWGAVLVKLDNLAHLTKWFVLDCIREDDSVPLKFVLCLLALEATRTVFATVNQVRGAEPAKRADWQFRCEVILM